MLTNLFYYDFYKPYIVHNMESGKYDKAVVKRDKLTDKKSAELNGNQYVILNKSLKSEVIEYAGRVSGHVTGIKDSSKYMIRDMEDFNKNIHKYGIDEAREWIGEDIAAFSKEFNKARSFMKSQKHSASLRGFSDDLDDLITYNSERLGQFGIKADENGELSFDADMFKGLSNKKLNRIIGETLQVFSDVYEQTTQLLTMPLSEHMNFRGLNYHYNYKMGKIITDSFNMIESGMIVDKVV